MAEKNGPALDAAGPLWHTLAKDRWAPAGSQAFSLAVYFLGGIAHGFLYLAHCPNCRRQRGLSGVREVRSGGYNPPAALASRRKASASRTVWAR